MAPPDQRSATRTLVKNTHKTNRPSQVMDWLKENVTEITELNLNKMTLNKLTVAYSIFLLPKTSLNDIWLK